MCGIVGAIHLNQQPVRADVIEQMANILKHRGPDDAGVFVDRVVGLGHRRLTIIDLSAAGHQPMRYYRHEWICWQEDQRLFC